MLGHRTSLFGSYPSPKKNKDTVVHQSLKMRATMPWIHAINLTRHGHPELNFLPVVKLHRIDQYVESELQVKINSSDLAMAISVKREPADHHTCLASPPVNGRGRRRYCTRCSRICTSTYELIRHQRACYGTERPHHCAHCGLSFTTNSGLKTHLHSHTRPKLYSCNKCLLRYTTLDRLTAHQKTHMVNHVYACDLCGLKFTSRRFLRDHNEAHRGERSYFFDQCDCNFHTSVGLSAHQAMHTRLKPFYQDPAISIKQEEPEVCQDLVTHHKMHMGKDHYSCDLCAGSEFITLKGLHIHNRVHGEDRSYSCDQCALRFLTSSGLSSHQAMHTRQCTARAISIKQEEPEVDQDLTTNQKMHLGEKHYSCDLCGLKFTRYTDLYRHNRVHSGEMSYSCDKCGLKFATLLSLKMHNKVHRLENFSYACDQCDINFHTISGLRGHQATHTRLKPFYPDLARTIISIKQEETKVCQDLGEPGVVEDYGQPVEGSEESGEESMESSMDSEESSMDSEESGEDSEESSKDSEESGEDSEESSKDSEESGEDSEEPWEVLVEPGEVSEYLISKNLNDAQTEWSEDSYYIATTAPVPERSLSVADVLLRDDADCLLYTGIPLQKFYTLASCLHVSAPTPSTIPVVDQILLTLMKLRQNFAVADLARRFTWSPGQVSETLNFWIDVIAEQTKELIRWLPCEPIEDTIPQVRQDNFPNATCIIDCTESVLQKPKHLDSRTESYSHYCANNSVKYLVATATSGIIMFISKAYGGKCSDRLIAQNSGFLDHLRAGDVVMGHHGFTIADLLEERNVRLVLPACSQKQCHLIDEVTQTRHIANVRFPVERAINRLKVYKILSQPVPIHLVPKIDNILIICAALVNLRGERIS